uniref:Uncharacterized protein n=1 Tax=Anguilla anguilla TaxID=7936 RepID=A0A0E9TT24_ANGAN
MNACSQSRTSLKINSC